MSEPMNGDCAVRYFAARTVVNVSGVVSETTSDADIDKTDTETISQAVIGTEADRNVSFCLLLHHELIHDRKFDLRLTADQRLAGVGVETTGLGYEAIAAAMSIVPLVEAAIPTAAAAAAAARVKSVEEEFAATNPRLAAARHDARKAVADVRAAIRTASVAAPPVPDQLKALETALGLVLQEATALELRFWEWRDRRFPARERRLSYALGTDTLLWRADAKAILDRSTLSDD